MAKALATKVLHTPGSPRNHMLFSRQRGTRPSRIPRMTSSTPWRVTGKNRTVFAKVPCVASCDKASWTRPFVQPWIGLLLVMFFKIHLSWF